MVIDLHQRIYSLPAAQKFVQLAGQELVSGISTVLLLPAYLSQTWFQQQLMDYLEIDHFIIAHTIDLRENSGFDPVQVLTGVLPEAGYLIERIEQLVVAESCPEVIILENLEICPSSYVNDWLAIIARWAEACNSSGSTHSLAVLASARAACNWQLPHVDVRLAYRLWMGIPSILETRLLCRMDIDGNYADAQWREYLLSSIAGDDPLLVEALWHVILGSSEQIYEALSQFAHKKGWEKSEIEQRISRWKPQPPGGGHRLKPTDSSFSLLSEGYTLYTPEYGEEIHPAALALLGRNKDVNHRIWRAQAGLILPWIDDLQRRICQLLAYTNEPEWIDEPPKELKELKIYLDNLPDSSKDKQDWGPTVYWAWRIRNELAHYRPITYGLYIKFWSLCLKAHGHIPQFFNQKGFYED
jgi:hypothetical protein